MAEALQAWGLADGPRFGCGLLLVLRRDLTQGRRQLNSGWVMIW